MNPLEQWLHAQTRGGCELYLMLETAGQGAEHAALTRDLGTEQFRPLYTGTAAESLGSSGPLLLRLDSVQHPAIQTLLATPERHWGWLASARHVELDVLTAHWRERVVTGERPNLAVYRVHDNRVLGRALAHLQPEQYAAFLGPFTSVCYWHTEQWHTADNPDPGLHPLPIDPPWLQTPTPQLIYANVLFDNTRRYLVGEHTEAMATLAEQRDVDEWLWGLVQLTLLWGWQQPEQVNFLLTRCLQLPDYRPPKTWLPQPGEDPAMHFERVYQEALCWQGDIGR
ncbi:DUF4123 domain-containing protein [Pseudomonas sp. R4-83]|uniref:DUF4123 domain-containing protein n=1 Tax=unclassified Pseudomonas TaxID=196821 RepID=UPI003DA99F68